jgi:(1->4)-alpha-D-glucan 1-alpha-D-glucosylmutase
VDPDNRRAVDYAARRDALRTIKALHAEQGAAKCAYSLLESLEDGRIKLYLTWVTLACRREAEPLFRDGDYLPLKVHGEQAERVCAFARHFGGETLLVVVPRLFGGLMGEEGRLPVGRTVWGDTWIELPPERMHEQWTNVLVGQPVAAHAAGEGGGLALERVFEHFPFALLRAHKAEVERSESVEEE